MFSFADKVPSVQIVLTRTLLSLTALFWAPVILLSVSLPFAYWDYLMIPYYCFQGTGAEIQPIWKNLVHSIFFDSIQYRPIGAFIQNVQYLAFGGEFWAWFLVKWLAFFGTGWSVFSFVRGYTRQFVPAL